MVSFKEGAHILTGVGQMPSAAWAEVAGLVGVKPGGSLAFRMVLDARGLVPGTLRVPNECMFLLSLSPPLPYPGDPARLQVLAVRLCVTGPRWAFVPSSLKWDS